MVFKYVLSTGKLQSALSWANCATSSLTVFVFVTLLGYFFKSSFINDDDIGPLINQSQHRIPLIDV